MVDLDNLDFIGCRPKQYRNGKVQIIDEVVSAEIPYLIKYTCIDGENIYTGEKDIYAYPHKVDELVIGHTVLDLLPCYNADFSYSIQQDNNVFNLSLSASHKKCIAKKHAIAQLEDLVAIMSKVLNAKGKWDGTGCFHRAALYHPLSGDIIIAEDIGRHNCVDRLKGHSIINKLPIEEYFLFITARITSSLYNKIYRAGIRTIISRSAITSTAFLNAQKENCTLAAFCRPEDNRVTLFTQGNAD